jgi:hypothetical protein
MTLTRRRTKVGRQTTLQWHLAPAFVGVVAALAFASNAGAVEYIAPPEASTLRPAGPPPLISAEDILAGFYPSVTVSATQDNNVFRTETDTESDTAVAVSPALAYITNLGRHRFTAQYRGDYVYHDKYSDSDTSDNTLRGGLALDMTDRLQGSLGAGYTEGHEARGAAGSRFLVPGEPDKFHETSGDAMITYGRRIATLQLLGAVGVSQLRYTNNNQDARDRDANSLRLAAFYNFSPITSFFLEGRRTDINYTETVAGLPNRDSVDTSYYLGARWEATAATVGEVRVGTTKKEFDNPSQADFSGSSYIGRVQWAPVTYSVFDFYASRTTQESTLLDSSYVLSTLYGVDWNHDLTERWRLDAFAEWDTDEYQAGGKDKLQSYGIGTAYNLLTWLDVGARYAHSTRNSDLAGFDYDDDLITLFLTAARQ